MGTWIAVRDGKSVRAWVLTGFRRKVIVCNNPCGFIALARG
jgi:hypothetical protein